jgi:hypothetical protein
MPWFARAIVAFLLAPAARAATAQERPSAFPSLIDPADGYLDASAFLARGGFIPVPIIITEPAVGGGLGLAGYFVRTPPPGSDAPPTRTIIGGAKTGNESRGARIMRSDRSETARSSTSPRPGAGRSTSTSIPSAAISESATPIPRASATCRHATGSATAASRPAPRRSTAPARCRSPASDSRGSPSGSRGRRRSARSASSCITTTATTR